VHTSLEVEERGSFWKGKSEVVVGKAVGKEAKRSVKGERQGEAQYFKPSWWGMVITKKPGQ